MASADPLLAPLEHESEAHKGLTCLIGLDKTELAHEIARIGLEPYRAKQLWRAIYHRGAQDFHTMTELAKPVRTILAEHYSLTRPTVSLDQQSLDGTRKWLAKFTDGREVESVHIPETDRGTLCISSQVGCTLTCRFCHTGTQRLVRNLSAAEIIAQILIARDFLGEWPSPTSGRLISNVVMMGMGEPLYNFEAVAKALKIIMDGEGIAISKRRITLSTSGVVPLIERCGRELGVNLAVSLHAVTDELRTRLMPINRKYPIATLMAALRAYPGLSNARRITFEYVMLHDVNDSPADARALIRLIAGIPAKINLIPFNPWPGTEFTSSAPAAIDRFAEILMDAGYASPIRTPRGRDILAACGQLKSASQRLSAAEHSRLAATYAEKEAQILSL
jgi:23S rRNA (adenine2503-C2)-methyltransferase